jgi:hypothetical protein
MIRYIKFLAFSFFASVCFGAGTVQFQNNGSGGGTVTISGPSGAGSGTITAVNAGTGLSGGGSSGSVTLTLSPSATMYIQNTNSLQSGSTAYPSFVYIGSSLTAPTIVDSGLASGQCIQTGTGGLLTVTGSACGSGGGGGSSTLAVSTGLVTGFSGFISSPTAVINFSSQTFTGQLTGTATAFITLNQSSVTLQGNTFNAANKLAILDAGGNMSLPTAFFSTLLSKPGYLFNNIGLDYGILQNEAIADVWSLSHNSVATSLGTPVLSWTAGNRVGIGTTGPATKLHMSSGVFTLDGTSPGIVLKAGGSITWPDGTIQVSSPTAGGGGGSGVSVYPATGTVLGIFNVVFDAAQAKLPGTGTPYISNSTGEFSASVYYDDTSTQSVTWSTDVYGYGGKTLFADILFTSTATSNYVCWGVYTATNTPNVSTNNYDSSTFNANVTTAVVVNANSLALSKATVQLSNTTIQNGQILTVKLERETGGCGNTEAVGFGRVKKIRIYE